MEASQKVNWSANALLMVSEMYDYLAEIASEEGRAASFYNPRHGPDRAAFSRQIDHLAVGYVWFC